MHTISEDELRQKLCKFYVEIKPQPKTKRQSNDNENQNKNNDYHKNSLKNLWAAINRHLYYIGRKKVNIVRGAKFRPCNDTLNVVLKKRIALGKSQLTRHYPVINDSDINKIGTHLESARSNPINLRLSIWYLVAFHFLTRGLEFHFQLKINSFEFLRDETGREYACLSHEYKQKKLSRRTLLRRI